MRLEPPFTVRFDPSGGQGHSTAAYLIVDARNRPLLALDTVYFLTPTQVQTPHAPNPECADMALLICDAINKSFDQKETDNDVGQVGSADGRG